MSKKKVKAKKSKSPSVGRKDLVGALKFYEYFEVPMSPAMFELKQRLDAGKKATEADYALFRLNCVSDIIERKHEAFKDEMFDEMHEASVSKFGRPKKKSKKRKKS